MAGAIVLGLSLAGCGATPQSQQAAAAGQPDAPAKPAPAMEPAQPAQPEKPAKPVEPMKPATPSEPMVPTGPQHPAKPAEPASPSGDESLAALKVPADDLVAQADRYVAAIDEAVASEDAFNDAKEEVGQECQHLDGDRPGVGPTPRTTASMEATRPSWRPPRSLRMPRIMARPRRRPGN